MTVIPERILQSVLANGLRQFRSNPKLLAVFFQNLTDPEFERIVTFVTQTPINLSINYPRKELTPPSIVIVLKNESESETFLGDFMGEGLAPPELVYDTAQGHAGSVSKVHGLPEKVFGPLSITGATSSSVLIDSLDFAQWAVDNNFNSNNLKLYIVAGAGKGRIYSINKINSDSIDILGSFSVLLDSTSVVDIRKSNTSLSIGEPARVFSSEALLTKKGSNFLANYDIDVVAGGPDEAIYLYNIVRAIIYLNKTYLEEQGLQALEISASDFGPKGDYIPDEVFLRRMNVKFHYEFSVLIEEEVFKELQLCIGSCAPGEVCMGATITLE